MAVCTHQQWLRVHQDKKSFVLEYDGRLHCITRSLPNPAYQYPSIILFAGGQSKSRAIRALFPGNSISRRRNYGIANICYDSGTLVDEYPLLIADSISGPSQINLRGNVACHETVTHQISWSDNEDTPAWQDLADHIHARVLLLFIDVLCLFAKDYGDLDAVAKKIVRWTTIGSASSLPSSVRPRLVIVTSITGADFCSEALRFRLQVLSDPKFSATFSSLQIVNVLDSPRSQNQNQFSGLGMTLRDEITTIRAEKTNTHTLFSMVHVAAFFDMALKNFAESPQHIFDFISASRERIPVSANFQQHLTSFLGLALKQKLPQYILWDFVASALILDSFPRDMHCRRLYPPNDCHANSGRVFNPADVFRAFYRHACLLGLHDFADPQQLSSELICAEIETHVISMFSDMKSSHQSAAAMRQQSLNRNCQYWRLLKSNIDCFICLQRKPEHVMECGHGICDICVSNSSFSTPTVGKEYHYDINTCPQCRSSIHFQARILPPTCRMRFLSIDGGGSRGVVSLAFMEELERALDLTYAVQEHFDFGIGTSSGKLADRLHWAS
jgi:hypothetical protein